MKQNDNRLIRNILIATIMGASSVQIVVPPSLVYAASQVLPNNTLPTGGNFITGGNNGQIISNGNVMNITQNAPNAVIKWNDFSIGANATVNFDFNKKDIFNTLNYVNGGNLSQIYGTINADNGNIFLVNPAGVEIGNSAQINVGSLYVSNKNLTDEQLKNINQQTNINDFIRNNGTNSNAELMSLGNINADNVTFDGDRIILDVDRIRQPDNKPSYNNPYGKYDSEKLKIYTTDKDKVIVGYTDQKYNETDGYNNDNNLEIIVNNDENEKVKAYKWVKDYEQLQAIGNTNNNKNSLDDNFALRNSIDANDKNFISIGEDDKEFTGNFDGLDYNIYGLTIDNKKDNTGLFGVVDGATIGNVNLISGTITGNNNTGALIGKIADSEGNVTKVENVINTAKVTGTDNVGGIIGNAKGNTAKVQLSGLINTGAVSGDSNVGGLVGNMNNAELGGTSYNLADISGIDNNGEVSHNIGGLVGNASSSTIGNKDTTEEVYNHLDVTGGYNVGGIVGNIDNTTVQNVSNDGKVTATGYTPEEYTFHTANTTNPDSTGGNYWSDETSKTKTISDVAVANAGGIVGNSSNNSTINNATNSADIQSSEITTNGDTYYIAGNVGGIVGKAMDTNIENVTNKEDEIRGAHNVGGIAGYFGNTDENATPKYTIENAINDGGDIMGTSARDTNGNVVTEVIRPIGGSREIFNVGNIGGIVGYMDGDNVSITTSGNRGTVHSKEIAEANKNNPLNSSKAANVGGIVGKIDRSTSADLDDIKDNVENAAVSNSYNSADVLGYTGVGGIVGMMYNGSVAGSYNTGYLRTTRLVAGANNIEALNMGGIVGDTTENTNSRSVLYDVYNKGQIGDDTYTYYGRHVGGVVGRLSGTVEKAYNNGAIYNGYNVVGGIVGWLSAGNVNNVFNTGNITVINQNSATSQVGGIAGAAGNAHGNVTISNAYNLGSLRSFKNGNSIGSTSIGNNSIGGILGEVSDGSLSTYNITIKNVYTTGNIYAGFINPDTGEISKDSAPQIGKIFGRSVKERTEGNSSTSYNLVANVSNAYYIKPSTTGAFNEYEIENNTHEQGNGNVSITNVDYDNRMNYNYTFDNKDDDWRIYEGMTTPILNAFMPDSSKFLGTTDWTDLGIADVQYGTAYDPLMTFITAKKNLNLNFSNLGITNSAGLVVKDHGLTLDDFTTANGAGGYFGGLIYADGDLNLKGKDNEDIKLAGTSKLYGSSVNITSKGDLTLNGLVQATAKNEGSSGDINITANNVDVYGTLKTARKNETVTIEGLNSTRGTNTVNGTVNDPNEDLTAVEDLYAYTVTSTASGNLNIQSNKDTSNPDESNNYKGDINLYYGNLGQGLIDVAGDVDLKGNNVYVDSDMIIDGNLNLTANETGEALIDISNIGKVSLGQYTTNLYEALANNAGNLNDVDAIETIKTEATESTISNAIIKGRMHNFLSSFEKAEGTTGKYINFSGTDNAKITVDLWDYTSNTYDLNKYDQGTTTLSGKLDKLNVKVNGADTDDKKGKDFVYIWVADGKQLKGIQEYKEQNPNSNILGYNFALKNDINATDVIGYQAIGGDGTAFTGTFDGRDNRIIGLNNESAGDSLFGTIDGTVKNVKVYSSNFDTNGAIAETNNGTIENVTGLGNHVTGTDGYIGGLVGENADNGTIKNSTDRSSVTANTDNIIGGLAGTNSGTIEDSSSNSAVIGNNATNLGGIVGENTGTINNVDSLGITNGANNVGGIVGINETNGSISNAYNESIVTGSEDVGGIAGTNTVKDTNLADETILGLENVANAGDITGTGNYTGGLIGSNSGTVDGGRNNARIEGNNYVGGLVGLNDTTSDLHNMTNDSSAYIVGEKYVGGIAGKNAGTIAGKDIGTSDTGEDDTENNEPSLVNRGTITGQQYVGGVAGQNTGTIDNVNSDISLNVKSSTKEAQYFGGVAGENTLKGTINNAINTADVTANGASYVGGVVGKNSGTLSGDIGNTGNVTGKDYVGGVAGENDVAINGKTNEVDMTTIENTGTVTAENGGAGGIFGVNNNDLEYVELINNGKVQGFVTGTSSTGVTGTGGIFGVNKGNITHSTLANKVNGIVQGNNNVGGLIGVNEGTITGGRTEEDNTDVGYYKYQIYNNGAIVGTDGENIGGLIGKNTGKLTAGYNTGAINIKNGKNIGGIVGYNAGTVDQVFNTVGGNVESVSVDENTSVDVKEEISGETNVGGLIGSNAGTLTNAYNTSTVTGTNATGNAIGNNEDTVSNIYATNTTGKLIGDGTSATNSYTFVNGDTSADNQLTKEEEQKAEASYTFANDDGKTWKFYDGSTNPLLKVFLTKVTFNEDGKPQLVYNGKEQTININGLIDNDGISAPDSFTAHENATLIQSNSHKDAGSYADWLYSGQINTNGTDGDPNNLGYDIEYSTKINVPENPPTSTIDIDKAKINVNLTEVERIYGDTNIINNGKYDFTYGIANGELTNEMKKELSNDNLQLSEVNTTKDDEALVDSGSKTNNVSNDYKWTGTVTLDDSLLKNYELVDNNNNVVDVDNNGSITTTGISKVTPKTLTLDDLLATIVYGNQNDKGLVLQNGNADILNGVVYGDNVNINWDEIQLNYLKDSAYDENKGNRVTADVNEYKNSLDVDNISLINNEKGNYKLDTTSTGGTIKVTPATLTVKLNDVEHKYGSPNLNSYRVSSVTGLTNGDTADIGVTMTNDSALKDGNTHTNNAGGNYTWTGNVSGLEALENNYDITVNNGNSTVSKANLTVDLNDVNHVYGSPNLNSYGIDNVIGLTNGDTADIGVIMTEDTALKDDNTHTNNAGGNYTWTGNVSGLEALKNNYDITVNDGKSTVSKAELIVDLNDVNHVYGSPNLNSYGIDNVTGLTNGDTADIDVIMTEDTALKDDNTHTNNAGGNYSWTGNVSGLETLENNYDITVNDGKSTVSKAELTVDLNNVNHVYGSPNLKDYDVLDVTGLVNGDEANYETIKDNATATMTSDSALKDNNTHTNDVGNYSWTGNVSGLEALENNYVIKINDGNSTVSKAKLIVDLNDNVQHEYGKPNLNDYTITKTEGLTNGDEAYEDSLNVTMTNDTALKDNNTHTNNAGGDYTWTGNVDGITNLDKNYAITIRPGKSNVNKAHLTITVDDSQVIIGDKPHYSGNIGTLPNGDTEESLGDIDFDVVDETLENKPGKHENIVGVIINDKFYPDGNYPDIFENYEVEIETGDLTVIPLSPEKESSKWGNLYNDAPWDKNRDFKERKAEFNHVDGGVAIEKNDKDIFIEA